MLKIMVGEVARKDDEQSRAVTETRARTAEAEQHPAPPTAPARSEGA